MQRCGPSVLFFLSYNLPSPFLAATTGAHDTPKPCYCGIYPDIVSDALWVFAAAFATRQPDPGSCRFSFRCCAKSDGDPCGNSPWSWAVRKPETFEVPRSVLRQAIFVLLMGAYGGQSVVEWYYLRNSCIVEFCRHSSTDGDAGALLCMSRLSTVL